MKKVSVLEERGRPTSGEEATAGRFEETIQGVMRFLVFGCRFLLTKPEKYDKIYVRRHIVNIYANRYAREYGYNDYNN